MGSTISQQLASLSGAEAALASQLRGAAAALDQVGASLPAALAELRSAAAGACDRIAVARAVLGAELAGVLADVSALTVELMEGLAPAPTPPPAAPALPVPVAQRVEALCPARVPHGWDSVEGLDYVAVPVEAPSVPQDSPAPEATPEPVGAPVANGRARRKPRKAG